MLTVKEIKNEVAKLKPEALARFRAWFEEFDAAMWDKQFENDVKYGRLDAIAEKAISEFNKGKFKEL